MWFNQNTPMQQQSGGMNEQNADAEKRRKQMLAVGLMQQATNAPAATGNAGTANILASALQGGMAGYLQRKPAQPMRTTGVYAGNLPTRGGQ